jgi:hypothetical protein
VLGDKTSPTDAVIELFPPRNGDSASHHAANRAIAIQGRHNFIDSLTATGALKTLLLDEQTLAALIAGRREEFLRARSLKLREYLRSFLAARTGTGLEATPPLAELNLDFDDDLPDDDLARGGAA